MIGRFLFNTALFGVLLAGIGIFLLGQRPELSVVDVVVTTVLGGAWAGALVALIETRIYPIADKSKRSIFAAGAGAAAYFGLFSGFVFLGGLLEKKPEFLVLGLALGAGSHALRARLYGGPQASSSSEEPE